MSLLNLLFVVLVAASVLFVLLGPKDLVSKVTNTVGNALQWAVAKVKSLFSKK